MTAHASAQGKKQDPESVLVAGERLLDTDQ